MGKMLLPEQVYFNLQLIKKKLKKKLKKKKSR